MSDIFDEYCRISIKQGIVKEAETKAITRVDKEKSKDYRDTIMALYGLDIESPNKGSIIEQAHPESLIIAPSYDRVNGLVENLQERQDIMVGICNKPTTGNHTHHRYAKKELLDELISLGFKLDNTGEDSLCVLADKCSVTLTNEMQKEAAFQKEAWFMAALPWIARAVAAASVWGAMKGEMVGHFDTSFVSAFKEADKALKSLHSVAADEDRYDIEEIQGVLKVVKSKSKRAYAILKDNKVVTTSGEDIVGTKKKMDLTKKESAEFERYLDIIEVVIERIGNRISLKKLLGGDGGMYPTILANVNEKRSDSDGWNSDIGRMAEGLWDSTLGEVVTPESNEKKYAINALYNVRDSLKKFYDSNKDKLSEGVAEVTEREKEIEQKLLAKVKSRKERGSMGPSDDDKSVEELFNYDEG